MDIYNKETSPLATGFSSIFGQNLQYEIGHERSRDLFFESDWLQPVIDSIIEKKYFT